MDYDVAVGLLTTFHFNVFSKKYWYAWLVPRILYNQESHFCFWDKNHLQPLKDKTLVIKSIKTF